MVIRHTLQCTSCGSKIITRTQVGHKEKQEHSFLCPNCSVPISYVLDLDPKKGKSSFREPKNAKWVDSDSGAIKVLTFSDEIPVPTDLPEMFSPFIATYGYYQDHDKYRKDETLRQMFVHDHFGYAERCMVHFEHGNWGLFDKESPSPTNHVVTVRSRLIDLYNLLTAGFSRLTLNSRPKHDRVMQRLTYAKTSEPALFNELASQYLGSGKIQTLWKEIAGVRRSFVQNYDFLQPLLQIHYWREKHRNLGAVKLSDKKFDPLRQLFIDCFETLCRLMTLVIAVEAIIHHKALEIPTKKGKMRVEQFEQLPNAAKLEHIKKYPIQDLFVPVIDADFRNGIGHHSAHYEAERDEIILYDTKHPGKMKRAVGYTEFCDKLLSLFAAFELAAMYHQDLHIYVNGRFV